MYFDEPTRHDTRSCEEKCCDIARRLAYSEQNAIDQCTQAIADLERLQAETGRGDISEMIADIKEILGDELDHSQKDNNWVAYFSGVKDLDEVTDENSEDESDEGEDNNGDDSDPDEESDSDDDSESDSDDEDDE